MTLFTIIAGLMFLSYIATALALLVGTYLSPSRPQHFPGEPESWPFVSVLIAARNEEQRLPGCLASLLQSEYPAHRFEIIVINDRSTDNTGALAQQYAVAHPQVRAFSVQQSLPAMSGKTNALAQGVQHARGDFFLFTDADCVVSPTWMPRMIACFSPAIGLVGGATLLHPPFWARRGTTTYRDTLFAKLQTLDWIYLLTLGAGAAGLKKPVSIMGNNFGVRRSAYEQIGGHHALRFSIVEDFALMQRLVHHTKWRVHFSLHAEAAVFSFPAENGSEFFEQRQRWATGGREFGGFAQYLMLLALFTHLAIAVAAFQSLTLSAAGLLGMLAAGFLLVWRGTAALQFSKLRKYFLLFRAYFLAYNLVFAPFYLLPLSVRWKGRRYRWHSRRDLPEMEEEPSASLP